jgi:hypothetical protein
LINFQPRNLRELKMKAEIIVTNQTIFKITAIFRELSTFVFESIGQDPQNTTIETFHDFGKLDFNSARTGFYSFRNKEFFYWVFIKGRHSENPIGPENLYFEFESQLKTVDATIFQAFTEYVDRGEGLLGKQLKPLQNIKVEFEDSYKTAANKIVLKLKENLI